MFFEKTIKILYLRLRIVLLRLLAFLPLRVLPEWLLCLRFFAPPLNTVTGGLTTPVAGSIENLRGISTKDIYLLRVALPFLPLRVAFLPLRVLLRLPPFKGIVVGAPMPPGKLHQT